MDRLSQGQLIAAGSGLLLLLSLFLPWTDFGIGDAVSEALPSGVEVPETDTPSASGWEANNTLDIYLFILAAFAIIPAAMSMGGSNEELPLINNAATFLLGAIGTIMTVYVLLDADGRKIGLILATLAVIGVTLGAYLAMQDEVGSEY